MAYYQTQPLVPNAYYVDIISGTPAGNAAGVSALQTGLSNIETVVDPVTQTVSANFLNAYTAGSPITIGAPLALSNNVSLQSLYGPLGGGAGLVSAFTGGGFIGINGFTGAVQAGAAGIVQMTMSTAATHYVSTASTFHRLTVEGAVYASTFHTLCPYQVFIGQDKQVMHITEDGRMGLGTTSPAAQLHVIGDIRGSGNVFVGGTIEISRDIIVRGNLIVEGDLQLSGSIIRKEIH
jgi:hypothetical protein